MLDNSILIFLMKNITYIIILFMLMIIALLRNGSKANSISNIVVSLGVLGTFSGIIIGLYHFDVSNIQNSIPELLNGLKTAFITSLAGMSLAILMKIDPRIIYSKKINGRNKTPEITIDTLAEKMTTGNSILLKISKALSGDEESTLLTQIQKLRTSSADNSDKLLTAFNSFAEKVTDLGSKSLTEALSHVIDDFNSKINEQFGENFKHLNEGVGRMLSWQKEYSGQIQIMTEQFALATDSIDQSKISLEKISKDSDRVLKMFEKTGPILNEISLQREQLSENMNVFAETAENAKNVMPIIKDGLEGITQSIYKTVTDISNIQKENLISVEKEMKEIISNSSNQTHTSLVEYYDELKKHLSKFDETLGETLNKSLNSLGQSMASLSGRFVEDYSPLTERLRNIVRISEDVNEKRIAS